MPSDDDLGPLPQLKAFTLTGPALFAVQPLVLVRIQDTKDTLGEHWEGLGSRFMKWSGENQIPIVKFLTSGGGYFEALFLPEDAGKIMTWLLEQGGQSKS
jgi:hypothetical protein